MLQLRVLYSPWKLNVETVSGNCSWKLRGNWEETEWKLRVLYNPWKLLVETESGNCPKWGSSRKIHLAGGRSSLFNVIQSASLTVSTMMRIPSNPIYCPLFNFEFIYLLEYIGYIRSGTSVFQAAGLPHSVKDIIQVQASKAAHNGP